MERTKSQSDSLVKVPLLQHHVEQLSLINQRRETDLQRIRGNIKRRNIAPCGPLTISHVTAYDSQRVGASALLRVIDIINTCWSLQSTYSAAAAAIFHSNPTVLIIITELALMIRRRTASAITSVPRHHWHRSTCYRCCSHVRPLAWWLHFKLVQLLKAWSSW